MEGKLNSCLFQQFSFLIKYYFFQGYIRDKDLPEHVLSDSSIIEILRSFAPVTNDHIVGSMPRMNLFDPYADNGQLLRCASYFGWTYHGFTANDSARRFTNKNWFAHLCSAANRETSPMGVYFASTYCITLKVT